MIFLKCMLGARRLQTSSYEREVCELLTPMFHYKLRNTCTDNRNARLLPEKDKKNEKADSTEQLIKSLLLENEGCETSVDNCVGNIYCKYGNKTLCYSAWAGRHVSRILIISALLNKKAK